MNLTALQVGGMLVKDAEAEEAEADDTATAGTAAGQLNNTNTHPRTPN